MSDVENEQRKRLEEAACQMKMKSSTENLVAKNKINQKLQQVCFFIRNIHLNFFFFARFIIFNFFLSLKVNV